MWDSREEVGGRPDLHFVSQWGILGFSERVETLQRDADREKQPSERGNRGMWGDEKETRRRGGVGEGKSSAAGFYL